MNKLKTIATATAVTLASTLFAPTTDAGLLSKIFGKKNIDVPPLEKYQAPENVEPSDMFENLQVPEQPAIYQRATGKTVIDECVDCDKVDYTIQVPRDQFVGRTGIERHLSEEQESGEVSLHNYDRHSMEDHKSVVDTFCGKNDYVELKLPHLTDEQRRAGYRLEFWTPTKDNSELEQKIMSVDNDGVVRITKKELAELPADSAGYRVLKTKNFVVLVDPDGAVCASYGLNYNAVTNDQCEPVLGTGPTESVYKAPTKPVRTGQKAPTKPKRQSLPDVEPIEAKPYTEGAVGLGIMSNTFESLSSLGDEVAADFDGIQVKAKIEKFNENSNLRATGVLTSSEGELNVERQNGDAYAIPVKQTAVSLEGSADFKVVGNRVGVVAGGAVGFKSFNVSEDLERNGYPDFYDVPPIVDQQNLYANARVGLGVFEKDKGFTGNYGFIAVGATGQQINENYMVGNAEFHPSSSVEVAPEISGEFKLFLDENRGMWVDGEFRYAPEVATAYTSMFNGMELVGEGESSYQNARLGIGGKINKSGSLNWNVGINYAHNEEVFKLDPDDVQRLQDILGDDFEVPEVMPSSHDGMAVTAGITFRW